MVYDYWQILCLIKLGHELNSQIDIESFEFHTFVFWFKQNSLARLLVIIIEELNLCIK